MRVIVAIVGMCGSGKSAACDVLREGSGWTYIRFGQLTIDRLVEEGREIIPENEKQMREALRKKYGMGVYAQLAIPKIDEALSRGNVVIDGLYSWSEYKILKGRYPEELNVIHIYASPRVRYDRLSRRHRSDDDTDHRMRTLNPEQAQKRDYAEIENVEKGGPIAMADVTIINEDSLENLKEQISRFISTPTDLP